MFSCEYKNLIRQLCDEYFFNVVWIFDFLNNQQFLFFNIFKSKNPNRIKEWSVPIISETFKNQ